MKQAKQRPDYTVVYRVAARLFDSAFAACERVPEADRELLLKEVGNRVEGMLGTNKQAKSVQVLGIEIKTEACRETGTTRSVKTVLSDLPISTRPVHRTIFKSR